MVQDLKGSSVVVLGSILHVRSSLCAHRHAGSIGQRGRGCSCVLICRNRSSVCAPSSILRRKKTQLWIGKARGQAALGELANQANLPTTISAAPPPRKHATTHACAAQCWRRSQGPLELRTFMCSIATYWGGGERGGPVRSEWALADSLMHLHSGMPARSPTLERHAPTAPPSLPRA